MAPVASAHREWATGKVTLELVPMLVANTWLASDSAFVNG